MPVLKLYCKRLYQNGRWHPTIVLEQHCKITARTYLQNRNNLLLITFYFTIHFVKILQKYQHQPYIFPLYYKSRSQLVDSAWKQTGAPAILQQFDNLIHRALCTSFNLNVFTNNMDREAVTCSVFRNSRRARIKRYHPVLLIAFPPRHLKRR